MDQPTIVDLHHKLANIFDHVSDPVYYNEEGPFFMAACKLGTDVQLYLYEANDVETFLADPEKLPTAFSKSFYLLKPPNDDAPEKAESINLDFTLSALRLVPDSPICRLAIQQLHAKNPDILSKIALIDAAGELIPAVTVINSPVLLM
jgi:hypothetical protein